MSQAKSSASPSLGGGIFGQKGPGFQSLEGPRAGLRIAKLRTKTFGVLRGLPDVYARES